MAPTGAVLALLIFVVPAAQALEVHSYGGTLLQPGQTFEANTGGWFTPVSGNVANYYGSGNTTVCQRVATPSRHQESCGINSTGNGMNSVAFLGEMESVGIINGGSTAHTIWGNYYTLYETMAEGKGSYYKQKLYPGENLESKDRRFRFVQQTDGNAVVYNTANQACWASNTAGHPGAYSVLQADGNFVVYTPGGTPLFSTGTFNNPGAYMSMQADGNLVIYTPNGAPLWATSWITGRAGC
ncbi:MAG TPA: hypothetical protein VHA54_05870 [Solirubrobacterales bacterium]|nr:hypothetical protein [Solirubrobacterales bacterium]